MKYIGIDVSRGGTTSRLVIAFPNHLVHAEMAGAIEKVCQSSWPDAIVETVIAGEIELRAHSTFGKSESLGLKSDGEDYRLLVASDYSGHMRETEE